MLCGWWDEENRQVTLHQILVHVATETHRHAGHADIVRELIDGAADDHAGLQQLAALAQPVINSVRLHAGVTVG